MGFMLFIKHLQIQAITAENLSIEAGTCVSLTGASGMGKSLFMKGLCDLVVNQGDVQFEGDLRSDMAAPFWRSRVCYVGAKPAWWLDNVRDHFQKPDWLEAQLTAFDLPVDAMDWAVTRLSSGEAQRLALLRALENTKDAALRYLLLDEPTSALDLERQKQVESYLQNCLEKKKIGVLFTSHDQEQVKRFAQKHWRIEDQRVYEVRP